MPEQSGAFRSQASVKPTHTPVRRRVMLVDDHPIVREGLRGLLRDTEFEVCAEAETVPEAKSLLRERKPEAIVLDLTLQYGDGLELVRDSRARYPQLRILVLSMQDELVYAQRLIAAGANGYLMKGSAVDHFVHALRRVCSGHMYLSEEASAQVFDRMTSGATPETNPVGDLSDRELQVLNLIGQGKSTREVSAELNLSTKTVESHRQRIKRKLALQTSAQLVNFAVNWSTGNRVRSE